MVLVILGPQEKIVNVIQRLIDKNTYIWNMLGHQILGMALNAKTKNVSRP